MESQDCSACGRDAEGCRGGSCAVGGELDGFGDGGGDGEYWGGYGELG